MHQLFICINSDLCVINSGLGCICVAYAYKLLSYSHKADPFCFAVPIASSIQNVTGVVDRNRSGLQNNLSFKKVGKMSASTTSETVQKTP